MDFIHVRLSLIITVTVCTSALPDQRFFMIDARQFIITNTAYQPEGWLSRPLSEGWILSYQEDLAVHSSPDGACLLLGDAWQTDPQQPSPIELVTQGRLTSREVFLNAEFSWCGRYVVLFQGELFLDASGSFGVFYGKGMVSSSLHVMSLAGGFTIPEPLIHHGIGPDYLPGAVTMDPEIQRLLPSQTLILQTLQPFLRKILSGSSPSYPSDEERTAGFVRYFAEGLRNMAAHFAGMPIYLALTGGRDSRAALAALEYAGIPYETFTLEHRQMMRGDITVPQLLAERLGRHHHWIPRNKSAYSQALAQDYRVHTSGMVVDEDALFYAYGQYQELQKTKGEPVLILRNNIWETVCDIYYSDYHLDHWDQETTLHYLMPAAAAFPSIRKSLDDWYQLAAKDNLNTEWSAADRFYYDTRGGCWTAGIEQGFDVMEGIHSVQAVNCRLFLSILMGYSVDKRQTKAHQEAIAAFACPAIADIRYGDTSSETLPAKVWNRCSNVWARLRNLSWQLSHWGIRRTVLFFRAAKHW